MKTLKKSHAVTVNRLQNNYIYPYDKKKSLSLSKRIKTTLKKSMMMKKNANKKKH